MKKIWNKIYNFFVEMSMRWKSTSPYFFKVIRWFSIPIGFIAGLAIALKAAGVAIPEPFSTWGDKAILVGAGTAYIMTRLPVDMDKVSKETKEKIKDNTPKSTVSE